MSHVYKENRLELLLVVPTASTPDYTAGKLILEKASELLVDTAGEPEIFDDIGVTTPATNNSHIPKYPAHLAGSFCASFLPDRTALAAWEWRRQQWRAIPKISER